MLNRLKMIPKDKRLSLIKVIIFDIFILLSSLSNDEIWLKLLGLIIFAILTFRIYQIIKNPDLIRVRKFERNQPSKKEFKIELNAIPESMTLREYQLRFGINLHRPSGLILAASFGLLFFYEFHDSNISMLGSVLLSILLSAIILFCLLLGTKLAFKRLKRTKYVVVGDNSKNKNKIYLERFGENTMRVKIGNFSIYDLVLRNSSQEIDEVFKIMAEAKQMKKIKS